MRKTSITIADLKIGEPLILGRYSAMPGRTPEPIMWLKASPNNNFITANVIDYCSHERVKDKAMLVMRWLDEYERQEIIQEDAAFIGLPTIADISHRFTLFNKKGVRANGTYDILSTFRCRKMGFTPTSYLPFWVDDMLGDHAGFIDRMGKVGSSPMSSGCGFRPICRLNAEAGLCIDDSGIFHIDSNRVYTDEELWTLLGIK